MTKNRLSIRTFILAGGLGKRLRSVVSDRPKPMAPIHGKPFLEILIRFLHAKGADDIVLLTGYRSEWIEDHFRSFSQPALRFCREDVPLGTGGAVKNAEHLASDPTLLVNGDTFLDADVRGLLTWHQEKGLAATLSLTEVTDTSRYGRVIRNSNGLVSRFEEKGNSKRQTGLINAGFTLLSRDAIKHLPSGRPFSMEGEVFPTLAACGRMTGFIQQGAFFDIGTPDSYEQFARYVRDQGLIY